MIGAAIRFIINVLVVVIAISAIYIIGLMFHVVPLAFTPQVLFKDQYISFKQMLKRDAAAKDATSGFSATVYDFLDTMENSYKPQPAVKVMPPKPATNASAMMNPAPAAAPAPQAPETTMAPATPMVPPAAAPQVPATAPAPQVPATPAASQAPAAPATPAPTQSTDDVTKAREVAQQYQNSVDQEKKTLDAL